MNRYINVSKLDLYIDKQQSENDFITNLLAKEKDTFERTYGPVYIKENGQLASHNFTVFPVSGEIRGRRQYNSGMHRIRLEIDNLDVHPWWFFGIISTSTAMKEKSYQSNSSFGWAGPNEIYMNGKCSKNVNGYTSDYSKGDVIELILDCDHHLIRMTNIRSTKSYEINIDLKDCPFPWMLHLNLFHHQTRIRINPSKVSR